MRISTTIPYLKKNIIALRYIDIYCIQNFELMSGLRTGWCDALFESTRNR